MKLRKRRLSLGLDLSTQSLSAVVIDVNKREKVFEESLDYLNDSRLAIYGIRSEDYLLPPRFPGEADQPPRLFLAALDALFSDLSRAGITRDIVVINNSAQQHGHAYLNGLASLTFSLLTRVKSEESNLVTLLGISFARDRAPIWMTSNTVKEAAFLREYIGGKEKMLKLSGSDSPLRFTGAVIRKTGLNSPAEYRDTGTIQLLSSFIPAVLTGNSKTPCDFGNASGTSMMNYARRQWSSLLLRAVSQGLPGGARALRLRLPSIVAPDAIVGRMAKYFTGKYGFRPDCLVAAGSGDNPQAKGLVAGDLLSLGTSFVNMVANEGRMVDKNGFANAMYDGLGRPFIFGCRTNGALVWDNLRTAYGLKKQDYALAERALGETSIFGSLVFWQPRAESLPASGCYDPVRIYPGPPSFRADYSGLIETTLAAVYHYSRNFSADNHEALYVTGGATDSPGVMRRIRAIWNRPTIQIEKAGAALGAAIAGALAYGKAANAETNHELLTNTLLKAGKPVYPDPRDVEMFHGLGGYFEKFAALTDRITIEHPLK